LLFLVSQWEIKQSNSLDFKRSVVWLSDIQDLIIQLKVIKSYQQCLLITALYQNCPRLNDLMNAFFKIILDISVAQMALTFCEWLVYL